jgi:negative regulator of sigma E activity
MEAVVWQKIGVFRRWPAFFSAMVYALAAAVLLLILTVTAPSNAHADETSPYSPVAQQTAGSSTTNTGDATVVSARKIPCTCRMNQQDYQVGDQVCIRGQRAVCGQVLNNTAWRFLGDACPTS